MKTIVIGNINIDNTYFVSSPPYLGHTIVCDKMYQTFGGKGANQAIASANFQVETAMLGCVGNDEYSSLAINNLANRNVFVEHIKKVEDKTGHSIITVFRSENQIISYKGANKQIDLEYIKNQVEYLNTATCIILQLHLDIEIIEYILDNINPEIITILNAAPATKISLKLAQKLSYVIMNEYEYQAIENCANMTIEEVINQNHNFIITVGKKGAYYYDHLVKHQAAFSMQPVDTTGAGDCFIGTFSAIIQKSDINQAIYYASIAAAISISKPTAQTCPTLDEIKNYIKTNNLNMINY